MKIRGIPLNLCTVSSIRKLSSMVVEFVKMENMNYARGFLTVNIEMDSEKPLVTGCWLS